MLYSSIIPYLFFLLSTSLFSSASPIGQPLGKDISKRNTEDDVLTIILDLQAKVDIIVPEIDALSTSGGDPSTLLAEISADIDVAVNAFLALTPDTSGVTDSKKEEIATIVVDIFIKLAVVLAKFPLTVVFLQIIVVVDVFFKKLLVNLDIVIVGIVKIIASLFTQADIDLFIKLKFVLTLAVLGIVA